jgi:hypothetical protein
VTVGIIAPNDKKFLTNTLMCIQAGKDKSAYRISAFFCEVVDTRVAL